MEVNRRSQSDRSEATRAALIGAARPLFAADGFGAVGTEAIVRAAGVTRGAMYHQFADKVELFAAVFEAVESELSARLAALLTEERPDVGSGVGPSAGALLEAGVEAWLDACADPEVQRIILVDGPAVLGWARWREIGMRHGAGLVGAAIESAIADGSLDPLPVRPLAHVLVGALEEAALYVVAADDPVAARGDVTLVLGRIIAGLVAVPEG